MVDLDLEKFLDRVNHDILMSRLARRVADKRLLRIVRRFPEAWMMQNGVCVRRYEGIRRAKELEPSLPTGEANKGAPGVDGMTVDDLGDWLAEHREDLVASLLEGSYQPQPVRGVEIPKQGGGVRQLGSPTVLDRLVQQGILQVLDPLLDLPFRSQATGFVPGSPAYRIAEVGHLHDEEGVQFVDHPFEADAWAGWIRRKLRCVGLKQRKRSKAITTFCWLLAGSGKGWWRLAGSPQAAEAMSLAWFREQGLVPLTERCSL